MKPLPAVPNIEFDPASYIDPHGRLGWVDDQPIRIIRPASRPFYEGLFEKGLIERWCAQNVLVESHLLKPTPDGGLAVKHTRIWPTSYCVEWSPSMLKDAALCTLDFAIELADHGLVLQDATPWNVLFDGSRPVFVDLTSVVPEDNKLIWPAYGQFLSHFRNPLFLSHAGRGRLARQMLFDHLNGIGEAELAGAAPLGLKLRRPSIALAAMIKAQIEKRPHLQTKIRNVAASQRLGPSQRQRAAFLGSLRRKVEGMRLSSAGNVWQDYYTGIPKDVDRQKKLDTVERVVRGIGPESVIDLGANTGPFSMIAARAGAKTIAVDSSEPCMDTLYLSAKSESLPITPLIADLMSPTPAFGNFGDQFPGLLQRARSDYALCLGLMHHLHVAGRQSFERIADLLGRVARRGVIFEFVAMDDTNNEWISAGREIGYDFDTVRGAIATVFPRIEILDSDRTTRKLLICEK